MTMGMDIPRRPVCDTMMFNASAPCETCTRRQAADALRFATFFRKAVLSAIAETFEEIAKEGQ